MIIPVYLWSFLHDYCRFLLSNCFHPWHQRVSFQPLLEILLQKSLAHTFLVLVMILNINFHLKALCMWEVCHLHHRLKAVNLRFHQVTPLWLNLFLVLQVCLHFITIPLVVTCHAYFWSVYFKHGLSNSYTNCSFFISGTIDRYGWDSQCPYSFLRSSIMSTICATNYPTTWGPIEASSICTSSFRWNLCEWI